MLTSTIVTLSNYIYFQHPYRFWSLYFSITTRMLWFTVNMLALIIGVSVVGGLLLISFCACICCCCCCKNSAKQKLKWMKQDAAAARKTEERKAKYAERYWSCYIHMVTTFSESHFFYVSTCEEISVLFSVYISLWELSWSSCNTVYIIHKMTAVYRHVTTN